jgi:hypothetical protein
MQCPRIKQSYFLHSRKENNAQCPQRRLLLLGDPFPSQSAIMHHGMASSFWSPAREFESQALLTKMNNACIVISVGILWLPGTHTKIGVHLK